MRPLFALPLLLVACEAPSPDLETDAGVEIEPNATSTGAEVLAERSACAESLQLVDGVLFWSEREGDATRSFRSSPDAFAPELIWEGTASGAWDFQVGDDAAYWLGEQWPVRLDFASGVATPLRKEPALDLAVVDRSRVFVRSGGRIVELLGDGTLGEIAAYPDGTTLGPMYAGPGDLYWVVPVGNDAAYVERRDVISGGGGTWFNLYWGATIVAAAADATHHYVVTRGGDTTALRVDDEYVGALPADTTAVAADNGSAYVIAGGTLRHVSIEELSDPLDVVDATGVATGDGIVVVSTCAAQGATGQIVRWWP
jgi:hypothetical protein